MPNNARERCRWRAGKMVAVLQAWAALARPFSFTIDRKATMVHSRVLWYVLPVSMILLDDTASAWRSIVAVELKDAMGLNSYQPFPEFIVKR
jgi:hypothetical protein